VGRRFRRESTVGKEMLYRFAQSRERSRDLIPKFTQVGRPQWSRRLGRMRSFEHEASKRDRKVDEIRSNPLSLDPNPRPPYSRPARTKTSTNTLLVASATILSPLAFPDSIRQFRRHQFRAESWHHLRSLPRCKRKVNSYPKPSRPYTLNSYN
jgi:hypothetical protein